MSPKVETGEAGTAIAARVEKEARVEQAVTAAPCMDCCSAGMEKAGMGALAVPVAWA
ncbi:MAG: hypothetical protein A4E47_01658 [Methanosaeta sp. PtaU1.Bin028]|nr:MAG: hypothetical protein A4E47_01658 [Methanosaeta sp. PtaU1.Bin028]